MSHNDTTWTDNEFEDDNDDEFNEAGSGWYDSDENVAEIEDHDDNHNNDNDANDWGDIDIADEVDVSEVDNQFWKGYYERADTNAALQSFLRVIELIDNGAEDTDEYKFKALTEIVILYFNTHNDTQKTVEYFKSFLSCAKRAKCNDLSSNIRKILNTVKSKDKILYETLHNLSMEAFKPIAAVTSGSMKHLWFRLGIERCHDYLDTNTFKKCEILIDELHSMLNKSETAKFLQVYSVKIQLTMRLIDDLAIAVHDDANERMDEFNALQLSLSELIDETQRIMTSSVDINDNESMSIIYECLATVFAANNDWSNAYNHFQKAFFFYQEIAHKNTTKCLKYLLIAYMIVSDPQIPNPFAMKEIKVFENHTDILRMNHLVNAFEKDDIEAFNRLLLKQRGDVDSDPFMAKYLSLVQLRLQAKALLNLVESYDRVKVDWLCRKLGMDTDAMEKLIVKLIMDGELKGRLDQMNMVLVLKEKDDQQNAVLNALQGWFKTVNGLRDVINVRAAQKVATAGGRTAGYSFGMDSFHDHAYEDDLYIDSAFISWD
eukprot:246337_1